MLEKRLEKTTQEESFECSDEYLDSLLEANIQIGKKPSYTREESELKNDIKSILYHQKKLPDSQIAEILNVENSTISLWRLKHHLPSNSLHARRKEEEVNIIKHEYPKTERELQLVREFLIKAIARYNGRGDNFSISSARDELVPSED